MVTKEQAAELRKVAPVPGRIVRSVKTYVFDADLPFNEWGPEVETLADRMAEQVYLGNEVVLLTGKVFKGNQTKPGQPHYKSYQDQIDMECATVTQDIHRQVSLFGLKPRLHFTGVTMVVGPTFSDVQNMKTRIIFDQNKREQIK